MRKHMSELNTVFEVAWRLEGIAQSADKIQGLVSEVEDGYEVATEAAKIRQWLEEVRALSGPVMFPGPVMFSEN